MYAKFNNGRFYTVLNIPTNHKNKFFVCKKQGSYCPKLNVHYTILKLVNRLQKLILQFCFKLTK